MYVGTNWIPFISIFSVTKTQRSPFLTGTKYYTLDIKTAHNPIIILQKEKQQNWLVLIEVLLLFMYVIINRLTTLFTLSSAHTKIRLTNSILSWNSL